MQSSSTSTAAALSGHVVADDPAPLRRASCAVCGEATGRPVCRRGAYELMQCHCGGMYLSPPVPDHAVDHAVDTHPDSFYALPAAMKLRWLRRSHPTGRLLEVGCGGGHFLRQARASGYEVCGIELDASRAHEVATELGIPVECAPIEQSQWPTGSCDIVYHCDLLSHFPDPLRALQQMRRLLRPGGVLFFEVGMVGDLAERWYDAVPARSIPRHRWFFSERALRQLLYRAGLDIERLKTFGLGPQVVVSRALSGTYQSVRRLAPRPVTSARSCPTGEAVVPGHAIRERPLEGQFNNFMRFSLGAWFPRAGPLTAFVLARPQ